MNIGVDIGGSHISAGIVDFNGNILEKKECINNAAFTYKEISKNIVDLCNALISRNDIGNVRSIGIGCPGSCDNGKGIIIYSNNINLSNAPIRDELQKYLNLPIYIENDANCAALAENTYGAARNTRSSVTVTLGTGIGGGIIIDNKIFNGFNFVGSELGHTVIKVDGLTCTCGRNGCWENYCSTRGLIHIASDFYDDTSKLTGKTIFDLARAKDKVALGILDIYIKYLAEGITNIVNFLMPEIIVIGGSISKGGDLFLEPLTELVRQKEYAKGDIPKTKIRLAEFQNDAGIVGAAISAVFSNNESFC